MVPLWLVHVVMLFAIEPRFFHRGLASPAGTGLGGPTIPRMERMHTALLRLGAIRGLAATAATHGLF